MYIPHKWKANSMSVTRPLIVNSYVTHVTRERVNVKEIMDLALQYHVV